MSEILRGWEEMGSAFTGLPTDEPHQMFVHREAIPLIFVPGVMGSRLRRAGTTVGGRRTEHGFDLPNLRWDPGDSGFLFELLRMSAAKRKMLIIGPEFDPDYLEVDDSNPTGDGFQGLFADYRPFLEQLRTRNWGALGKLFEFPVYGFGYNWSNNNRTSGQRLADRITAIIDEARRVVGRCEKVILITHSMGGLVSRAASELCGARGKILGIVHGVQPVTGSGATYWRMKAGFEGSYGTALALGSDGTLTTPILCNSPGGLQLLPTKHYRNSAGEHQWLEVPTPNGGTLRLPSADPYAEIYRVPAQVQIPSGGSGASNNAFWGLVDPRLLVPESVPATGRGANSPNDSLSDQMEMDDAWDHYESLLGEAERFHDSLGLAQHPNTFTFWGNANLTAEVVRMVAETYYVDRSPYQTQGFFGHYAADNGVLMRAVLQPPAQSGDGTVPSVSGRRLRVNGRILPGDSGIAVGHQPAYEAAAAQGFTIRAILSLVRTHYKSKTGR